MQAVGTVVNFVKDVYEDAKAFVTEKVIPTVTRYVQDKGREIKAKAEEVWEKTKDVFEEGCELIIEGKEALGDVIQSVGQWWNESDLKQGICDFAEKVSDAWENSQIGQTCAAVYTKLSMTAQELASAFENSKVGQFCKKASNAITEFYEEHKTAINLVVGAVLLVACTAVTIATAGSGGFLYAVAFGALKGAVAGAVGGLVTGAVEYYEENGTLDGSGQHIWETTMQGMTTGFIAGGAGGAADEILKYAKSASSFCFVAGTLILTADGTCAIEDVKIGDKVLSTDPETGDTTEKIVLQTFERQTTEFVDVTIGGETYTTTPEHPFYVEGKDFVNASELEVGDKVVCYDTETDTTETKEVEEVYSYETDEPVTVYNFEVHEYHTYHVGEDGVLVHNDCKKPGGSNTSVGSSDTVPDSGYNSFKELKQHVESAGEGNAWHHIVEQSQISKSGFSSSQINNVRNIISVPHGAGSIHAKISGFYSSIPASGFTNGSTVRQWLTGQTFQQQFDFGMDVLKQFGEVTGTSNGWKFTPFN